MCTLIKYNHPEIQRELKNKIPKSFASRKVRNFGKKESLQ